MPLLNKRWVGSEEKKAIDRLQEWVRANGAKYSKIKLAYYSTDFRGIHASRRIKKGERILTIGEKLLLTETSASRDSPLGRKILNCGVSIDYPYCTAIACLLLEAKKDPKHWWRPYADVFPLDASSFPYFFTGADREALTGLNIVGIHPTPSPPRTHGT